MTWVGGWPKDHHVYVADAVQIIQQISLNWLNPGTWKGARRAFAGLPFLPQLRTPIFGARPVRGRPLVRNRRLYPYECPSLWAPSRWRQGSRPAGT
jgi:hypothetical protein